MTVFMDRLVEHVFALQPNGEIRDYPGNYSDYRNALEKEKYLRAPSSTVTGQSAPRKADDAQRKEMQKLEKQLDKLEEEKRNCLLILVKAVLIILISRLINFG